MTKYFHTFSECAGTLYNCKFATAVPRHRLLQEVYYWASRA